MQNCVQNAYEEISVKDYASKLPSVYGTVCARLEESTMESYQEFISASSLASGEASRKIPHFVDHKPTEIRPSPEMNPSDDVLDGLGKMVVHAFIGEDYEHTIFDPKDKPLWLGPCLLPVKEKNKKKLSMDCEDIDEVSIQLQEKRKSIDPRDNPILWSQNIRYWQQCIKEAMLATCVDAIVYDQEFKITKKYWEYGKSYIDECNRAVNANDFLYDGKDKELIQAILEMSLEALDPNNKKHDAYIKYHYSSKAVGQKKFSDMAEEERRIDKSYIFNGTTRPRNLAKAIADGDSVKMKIVQDNALKEGENEGLWKFHDKREMLPDKSVKPNAKVYLITYNSQP